MTAARLLASPIFRVSNSWLLTSGSGMSGAIDPAQLFGVHIRIALGSAQRGMAKKLLNGAQIPTPSQQMGSEAVA